MGRPTHRKTGTPEHDTWLSMRKRCLSKTSTIYKNYGGKGITICDRWKNNFENFFNDMGEKPSSSHSIDRIDVNGNYEPSNCRWADRITQSRNQNISKRNKSGCRGVYSDGKKWRVNISVNYKRINIGTFINFEDAVKARKEAELKYW